MRALRTIMIWLGVILLGVVLLVVGAFLAIQTPPGKAWLASLASSLASSDGLKVEIDRLEGFIPSDMRVASIRVADADGLFAEVENVRLAWRPLELIGGRLDIADAGARRVALLRKPNLPPAAEEAPASEGGGFALPVRIGRFTVDEIDIAEPVFGHAAVLSLAASAELLALERGLSATFDLKRTDEPGSVTGRLNYVPDTQVLDLDVAAQEPAGGLIARAAGLEGLPALAATLTGSGPLDAWDGHLDVSAGDAAHITGAAGIRAVAGGRRVTFAIDADASRLAPANIAPLIEGRTELAGTATVDEALKVTIETATIRAAGFGAGVKGALDANAMSADLAFTFTAGEATRFAALAPGVGWQSLAAEGTVKGALATPAVVARVNAGGLTGAGYGATALVVNARTLPDTSGGLALDLDGTADGLTAADPKVASALGPTARFTVNGVKPRVGPVALTGLTAQLTALTARFAGRASSEAVAGTLNVERLDLAALSPLAGRTLAGTMTLEAGIDASGDLARADVSLKGETRGVITGIAQVDGLFGGTTTIAGALARDGENAIRINGLNIAAEGLSITADGSVSKANADLAAKLALNDLARLDPRVSGAVRGEAAFSGNLDALGLTANLSVPNGTAMKQPVENLNLAVTARDLTGRPSADLKLAGTVARKPATISAAYAALDQNAHQIRGLDVAIGSVTAKGDVTVDAQSRATGALTVRAGNLADLSALALAELSGSLNADIRLDVTDGKQRVAVKADADKITAAGQSVGGARIDATVVDPAGVPTLDGSAQLSAVRAGGMDIPRAALTAKGGTAGTALTLDAAVNGANLAANGVLSQQGGNPAFRLDRLNLARGTVTVTTSAPANFMWSANQLTIDRLVLVTGGGTSTISGRAGSELDLTVDLRALPLSLAELASPGLGLSGTLSGNARLQGPAATLTGNYALTIARLSNPDLARNGVGPLDIRAEGRLAGGRATTQASITAPYMSGVTITGSAPLGAGELDLAMRGALDLGIANPLLAASGMSVTGRAAIDATLRGTPAAPRAGGTVRVTGGRFLDSVNGVNLANIEALVTGTERSVTLSSLSARTPNGGGLSGRGSVALDPAAGFPGKIDIDLNSAGLVNSDLMRLVAEGRVAAEGAFANNPRIAGRLVVRSLDVNIADRLPGGGETLNVRHVNTGARAANGRRATPAPRPAAARPANAGMPLDLTVSAPNNVFVRGMGLTAELGGDIRVGGTTASPITDGGFEMRRGTFDILGKRLNFTRGRITFTGTTDPDLDFVAETTANDITAQILVTGPASRPDVTFTSNPTLPQDEVLSRLMFGRAAGSLTPGQAIQVAQTIAQFSGGGAGVLDRMRRSLGVDSLDVGTNSAGTGGQVGIGRRLNDRMYLGVRGGTTPGSSQVTVDVDITKNIRLQGATGADGSAEVGIGAQWDY
ncbi:translocation/assembly module TamB domain-containing protein [Bosea sp. 117]|uniref:translocation/assembly module TamB domain-containing protein n=1 Tax=Bosea sp. 117 TaxID=1125973 RepID=UPI000B0051B2|nr:translocation/assembly module TamB domain-containing protein [Bosea sp. 117]